MDDLSGVLCAYKYERISIADVHLVFDYNTVYIVMQVHFTAHIRQTDNRKLFENGNGQRIGRAALGKQVLRSQ